MNAIEKTIYFYSILFQPSFGDVYSLVDIFKSVFNRGIDTYNISPNYSDQSQVDKEILYFEIQQFDDHSMFGLFGKTDDLQLKMTRLRNPSTMETAPFSLPGNMRLENYTYFFIDFDHEIMAVIRNQKTSSVHLHLQKYFESIEYHVSITPLIVPDISKRLSEFKEVSQVKFKFSNRYDESIHKFIQDLGITTDNYSVSIKAKKVSPTFFRRISSAQKSDYASVRITGINDENIEETIDVLEKSFTRSTKIKISEKNEENDKEINRLLTLEVRKLVSTNI